jgi:hypothetical protein
MGSLQRERRSQSFRSTLCPRQKQIAGLPDRQRSVGLNGCVVSLVWRMAAPLAFLRFHSCGPCKREYRVQAAVDSVLGLEEVTLKGEVMVELSACANAQIAAFSTPEHPGGCLPWKRHAPACGLGMVSFPQHAAQTMRSPSTLGNQGATMPWRASFKPNQYFQHRI